MPCGIGAFSYAVENVGQTGSTPVHGYCDILLHTGSSEESHVISQNADIRRSAKQTNIDSAIYI